jgi:hypothetical protein
MKNVCLDKMNRLLKFRPFAKKLHAYLNLSFSSFRSLLPPLSFSFPLFLFAFRLEWLFNYPIKNVSYSTSHKKLCLYVFTSFREFKKILPSTFIYESILIINYMNTNIMNTQIFYKKNYDLKGHWRS